MATRKVLVTGGAGFIGSHLVDALVAKGHAVTVLDSFDPQVHRRMPSALNPKARYVVGDVRDRDLLKGLVADAEAVFHQAARVGVGQSMYQIEKYVDVCTMGTARLLDVLANEKHGVRKLVVASSMSCYGEGLYRCPAHGEVSPQLREEVQLRAGDWEPRCPECRAALAPASTPETKPFQCTSVYALAKRDQEDYCLLVGQTYGISTVALRYFNVYGPRQSLSNPYTGVCAIFLSRIKNGKPPVVYEDGRQTRDFVSVHDIVQANLLALESQAASGCSYNVGTGVPISVLDVARTLLKLCDSSFQPVIARSFRAGDIRHCYSNIDRIRRELGYKPAVSFEDGMAELVAWSRTAEAVDLFEQAQRELEARGLLEAGSGASKSA